MPTALVDEGRPPAGPPVQPAPMRLSAFDQLVGAVTHALLPRPRLERSSVRLQAFCDLAHAANTSEVRAEPGQPVVDDVRVGVVEAGQDAGARQVDHTRARPAQAQQLRTTDRKHAAGGDREVAVRFEARAPECPDAAASEYQVGLQANARLSSGSPSTS